MIHFREDESILISNDRHRLFNAWKSNERQTPGARLRRVKMDRNDRKSSVSVDG